ncbi:unnamed protein product [Auanema sp. JU1783]|nr:unnamed protein product [Auanema sp. JU1783]
MSFSPSSTDLEDSMKTIQDHIDMVSTQSIQNMADCQAWTLSHRDSVTPTSSVDLIQMMGGIEENASRVLIGSLNNEVDCNTWTSS